MLLSTQFGIARLQRDASLGRFGYPLSSSRTGNPSARVTRHA
jgi:hypothetical protein